jgi:multimeric flavodoxin WrbA
MKKITAVIGSPRGSKSTTAMLTKNFMELVKEHCPDLEYEIIMLDGSSLSCCKGCMACTKAGECIIVNDDLQSILQKLKKSDMVILGSPVYVNTVSAQFKVFADRIFVWLHTLRLLGKPSLSVITTAGSGISPTKKYLDMILYLLGTIPMGCLTASEYKNKDYYTMEYCRKKYTPLAIKAAKILNGNIRLKPRFLNNFYFWCMKAKAKYGAEWLPYENTYWKNS